MHTASFQNWDRNIGVPMPAQIPAIIRFLGYVPFPTPCCQGDLFRSVRVCCGWTQADVANASGSNENSIGRWEAGKNPDRIKWNAAVDSLKKHVGELGLGKILNPLVVALAGQAVKGPT